MANTNCQMKKVNVDCKEQTVVPDWGIQLHQHWIYCAWFSQVIYTDYTTFSLFVACLGNQSLFVIYINSFATLWKILKKTFIFLAPPTSEDCTQSKLFWTVPKGLARIWGTPKMSWKTLYRILRKSWSVNVQVNSFLRPESAACSCQQEKTLHIQGTSIILNHWVWIRIIIRHDMEVLFPQSVHPKLGDTFRP